MLFNLQMIPSIQYRQMRIQFLSNRNKFLICLLIMFIIIGLIIGIIFLMKKDHVSYFEIITSSTTMGTTTTSTLFITQSISSRFC